VKLRILSGDGQQHLMVRTDYTAHHIDIGGRARQTEKMIDRKAAKTMKRNALA